MRKTAIEIAKAFCEGKTLRVGNTMTDGQAIYLHGNKIAWKDAPYVRLTLARYPTVTTRSRLNDICEFFKHGRPFAQKNWDQFFNGEETGSRDVVEIEVPWLFSE